MSPIHNRKIGINMSSNDIQLALFEVPTPLVRKSAHDLMWERACHPSVDADVIAICAAQPGEWLEYSAFRSVIEKHDLQGVMGHALFRIHRTAKLEIKNVYFGDEHPGGKNYQGYKCVYRMPAGAEA